MGLGEKLVVAAIAAVAAEDTADWKDGSDGSDGEGGNADEHVEMAENVGDGAHGDITPNPVARRRCCAD